MSGRRSAWPLLLDDTPVWTCAHRHARATILLRSSCLLVLLSGAFGKEQLARLPEAHNAWQTGCNLAGPAVLTARSSEQASLGVRRPVRSVVSLRGGLSLKFRVRGWTDTESEHSGEDTSNSDEEAEGSGVSLAREEKPGASTNSTAPANKHKKAASTDLYGKTMARRTVLHRLVKVLQWVLSRVLIALVISKVLELLGVHTWWLKIVFLVHLLIKFFLKRSTPPGIPGRAPAGGSLGPLGPLSALGGAGKRHLSFEKLNDAYQKDADAFKALQRPGMESQLHSLAQAWGPVLQRRGTPPAGSAGPQDNCSRSDDPPSHQPAMAANATSAANSTPASAISQSQPAAAASSPVSVPASPATPAPRGRVFVLKFDGMYTTGMGKDAEDLAFWGDQLSFVLNVANATTDEVVVLVDSPGGGVAPFGLAAAQLARVRDAGIPLTVCVDQMAASGGFMVACVASWLVAAPFSMVGSIGVRAGAVNVHRALKKRGIDSVLLTGGRHKAGIDAVNEITADMLQHTKNHINVVHTSFKNHVKRWRPMVDVDAVGTGEVWLGADAQAHGLVDEIGTSGAYLRSRMADADVYLLKKFDGQGAGLGLGVLRKLLFGPFASATTKRASKSFSRLAMVLGILTRLLQISQENERQPLGPVRNSQPMVQDTDGLALRQDTLGRDQQIMLHDDTLDAVSVRAFLPATLY